MRSFVTSIRPDAPGSKVGDDSSLEFVTCPNAGNVVHFFDYYA